MSMISRVAVLEALTAKVEAASYTPLRQTEMWAEDPPYSITEEARLPSGVTVRFITGGDSFHRGQYNGWIAAEVGGQRVGTIQYSLTGAGTGRPAYHIDMIEVDEGWRRKGIATALYERMLEGEPNTVTVDPGSLLPDGAKWWPTVSTTAQADAQGWWYHFGAGTSRDMMGEYVHLGTRNAAIARMREVRQGGWGELVRVRIQPRNPLNSPQNPMSDNDANLMGAWESYYPSERGQMPEVGEVQFGLRGEPAEVARRWGYRGAWIHDAIYYRNTVEDPGSISVMVDSDCIVSEEIAPPQVPGVGPDHPRLFAHKVAYLGLDMEVWDFLSDLVDTLGQRRTDKVCYEASNALARRFGWEVESGYFAGMGLREGHYWNRLPDGTIVDAAHDQFDEDAFDPVLVVPPGDPRQSWYESH